MDPDTVDEKLVRHTTSAQLLFLAEFVWGEQDQHQCLSSDSPSRQSLCQGQLNWWGRTSVRVLPLFFDVIHQGSYWIMAGGTKSDHDGGMLVFRSGEASDHFDVYISTILQLRRAGRGGGNSFGMSFGKGIISRS